MKDITDPECRVLMSDFGTCVKLKNDKERLKTSCSTKIYWPPEFYAANYSFPVDCWALGVIMYGLLDGRFPFKGEKDVKEKEPKLPGNIPKVCTSLVLALLEKKEEKRIKAPDLVKHDWIKDKKGADAGGGGGDDGGAADFKPEGLREGGANTAQD